MDGQPESGTVGQRNFNFNLNCAEGIEPRGDGEIYLSAPTSTRAQEARGIFGAQAAGLEQNRPGSDGAGTCDNLNRSRDQVVSMDEIRSWASNPTAADCPQLSDHRATVNSYFFQSSTPLAAAYPSLSQCSANVKVGELSVALADSVSIRTVGISTVQGSSQGLPKEVWSRVRRFKSRTEELMKQEKSNGFTGENN